MHLSLHPIPAPPLHAPCLPLKAVMDTVKSTLGPRGMDKLIFDGQKVSNQRKIKE